LAVESKSSSDELVKIEQDKTEKIREELKKQNDDRLRQLSEEERHALALAGINRAGEEELLKIRLDYAKKKQAILKSTPGIDLTTLKNAANVIKEIELELSKNQEGSIKALSDRVSNLREQITSELVIGSDEFKTAIDEYFILYKELQEANKALEPVDVEIFVPGSLNQLQQEVDRLNEIISGLAPDDAEFAGALEKLNIAKAKLKELNDLINAEAEKDNTSQRLLEILSEEERHALALAGIRKKSEEDKLRIQLEYAQKRLDALKAETELNEVEILKTENIISELSEQLQNSIGKITFKDAFLKLSGEIQSLVSEVFNASNTIINIRQRE
jgi:DNA repair exonuclease SbcCD ATPase subunit